MAVTYIQVKQPDLYCCHNRFLLKLKLKSELQHEKTGVKKSEKPWIFVAVMVTWKI